jgi:gluconolactonase
VTDLLLRAEVLVDGLDHPEGVAYDHRRKILYAGGEEGQVYAIDVATRTFREIARIPGFVLGLAVDGVGRVVVCDAEDGAVWVLDDGEPIRLVDRAGDRILDMPNYAAFGADGTLYLSDSGHWKQDDGAVIAVATDGTAEVMDTTLCRFPNGCAVTPDGKELWMIQSLGPDVSRFDLVAGGRPETVVTLPGTVPDGIAFTTDGGAVLSCYRPDRIYYLGPDGRLEILAEDPEGTLLAAPTNICFVGEDRSTLVSANLGRWHLTVLETGLTGVVPHAPAVWAVDGLAGD